VIGIATHSESGERLVVYRPQYGERALWGTPAGDVHGNRVVDGVRRRRFERLSV